MYVVYLPVSPNKIVSRIGSIKKEETWISDPGGRRPNVEIKFNTTKIDKRGCVYALRKCCYNTIICSKKFESRILRTAGRQEWEI